MTLVSQPIRVAIADDHAITRYALGKFIGAQKDMRVVAEAADGEGVMAIARKQEAQVLLLDLMMPGRNGLDALPAIRARTPGMAVIVISGLPPEQYAVKAMRLGASGFIRKDCDPDELLRAIRTVHAGRHYVTPDVAQLLANASVAPAAQAPHESLTKREFALLLHFAKGQSSAQIADSLSLSPKTVSTYRTLLLRKMGFKTNSQITHYAIERGLLD